MKKNIYLGLAICLIVVMSGYLITHFVKSKRLARFYVGHIIQPDRLLGYVPKPNIREARVTIPGRPHPLPFSPSPAYASRITRRVTFTCSTNSEGLRGREFSIRKAEDTFRIVCVGECVTFGNGVNDHETFPYQLEEILKAKHPERRFEVINAGVNAYNSPQVLGLLRTKVVNYQPDAIIVCPGANTVVHPAHTGRAPTRVWLEEEEYKKDLKLYRDDLQTMVNIAQQSNIKILFLTPTFNYFFPFPDGETYIDALKEMAQRDRIPCIDSASLFKSMERENGLILISEEGKQRLISNKEGKGTILREVDYIDEENVQYISSEIYEYLDSHPEVSQLLSIDGNHPNPRGQRLIAGEIYKVLVSEKIVSP